MSASLKGLIAFINSQPSELEIDHDCGFSYCAFGTYLKQFEEIERSDYSNHFNLMEDEEKVLMGLPDDTCNYNETFKVSLMNLINCPKSVENLKHTNTYGGYQAFIKTLPHLNELV